MIDFIINYYYLIFYIIVVIAFLIYSVSGLYNLSQFGYEGDLSKPVSIVYILASLIILILSSIGLFFIGA